MENPVKFAAEADKQKPAEIVASIDDLLTVILLRLPILSLIRFKLVCKHWLSIITNPRFCQLRNPKPNPAVGLFLPLPSTNFQEDAHQSVFEYVPFCTQKSISKPSLRKLNFTGENHQTFGIRILQSCNGFMLCKCSISSVDNKFRYSVYNPTTDKFSMLPKSGDDEVNGNSKRICGMSLAFDPVKSHHYKVVCVWSRRQEMDIPDDDDNDNISQFQIEIYSSKTDSWRLCGNPFTALVNFENGVYWNGSIHWLTATRNGESLYFNIDNQILQRMPILPVTYSLHCKRHYYFGESCDHLHFIDMRGPRIKFNVYELKRDYSEWFVKYKVDLSAVVAANPEMSLSHSNPLMGWCSFIFSVFTIIRGEKEEDSFLVLQILGKAIRYNLVSKTFQNLHDFEGGGFKHSLKHPSVTAFQHIQSFCWV